jgi:hypothetical protein
MKIFIFDSIHYVLKAEKILSNYLIKIDLIPVPKEIHSNCGMAISIKDKDFDNAKKLILENNINVQIFSYNPELNFYIQEDI